MPSVCSKRPSAVEILAVIMTTLVVCAGTASALDNGLARTPPMGWNSWNAFGLQMDEAKVRSTADAMVSNGMKGAGYEYIIVDAGWKAKNRDPEGRLRADPDKFPSGMKALADYMHSKGLKFGIYTDAGSEDCVSGDPGSKGFEEIDAASFAEWGVDYVKEDWCHTTGVNAREAYTKMSQAILKTGRPMVFSMCEWGDNEPWTWAAPVAHLWRTTGDSKDCWDCGRSTMNKPGGYPRGWVLILDAQRPLASFAGPGHWNDPDLLQIGHPGLTVDESRAQFSLWAILAAPLMATTDLKSISPEIREIFTNAEVIAVDQDAKGIEGTRVRAEGNTEVWTRVLADGSRAIVLFNRSKSPRTVTVQWTDVGGKRTDELAVRDLWKHRDLGTLKGAYSALVPSHGIVMIKAASPTALPITLENSTVKAHFDSHTGVLLALESKLTGWHVQNRPELGRSFEMIVPLPDRRDNPVRGAKTPLASAEVSLDKSSVSFVWKDLASEYGGKLDITFKSTVTLNDDGLAFRSEVVNHSPYTVETISYPILGDVPLPPGEKKLQRANWSYGHLQQTGLLPEFANERGYFGVDYPIQMVQSTNNQLFILLQGEKQGLYGVVQDPSLTELVNWTFELRPGYQGSVRGTAPSTAQISGHPVHLLFSAIHYPFAATGESAALSPIVLKPYSGTWHSGVDLYKQWRATWFQEPAAPEWVKQVHSWQQLNMNSPEDDLRLKYKDLVQVGEEAAKYGVKAVQLVGWNHGGQDRGNPSQDTDDRLGTAEEFKDAITRVQRLGVNMILFSKYTWADVTTDAYKSELRGLTAKDPYNDPYVWGGWEYQTPTQLADINTRRLAAMCSSSARWREIAGKEFQKILDYGPAGMLYDEVGWHGPAQYCFAPDHGHHSPALLFSGDLLLAKQFREMAAAQNPQFLFSGEAPTDVESQYYVLSYFRIGPGYVAVDRYINPFKPIMIAVIGYDDREMINNCLMDRFIMSYEPLNFKGRLSDFPLTMAYGKKVDALREKYKEYLWNAEFRDKLGAEVVVDGKPYDQYSVFGRKESGRRAVVIVNEDLQKPITATVKLEGANLEGRSQAFFSVAPEDMTPKPNSGTITIPARSAAVLLEGWNAQ